MRRNLSKSSRDLNAFTEKQDKNDMDSSRILDSHRPLVTPKQDKSKRVESELKSQMK